LPKADELLPRARELAAMSLSAGAASRVDTSAPAFVTTLRAECRRAFVRGEAVPLRRGVEGGREAAAQLAMLRPQ
jgi:hypothetical protein